LPDRSAGRASDMGDLKPHWVYPGPAKIERHVLPLGSSL
jgi:hypothetical protein